MIFSNSSHLDLSYGILPGALSVLNAGMYGGLIET